jgi:para-aminobenzoate synthetase/4-amino-4-deoxychorismate lyase
MGWISRLETAPRNVYCGAIGYIRPGGESVFNVPIRTLLLDAETGTAEYGVGGGVTWDSTREGEYAEAWLKAEVLTQEAPEFDLLETLLLEDGVFSLPARHLERLAASARYFGFTPGDAEGALARFAERHPAGRRRVRLTASRSGRVEVSGTALEEASASRLFAFATAPVQSGNRFLYHKTTNREHYAARRVDHADVFDVLLWNERGEVTEFTTGNVVVEIGGRRWTPPVESGLLAGTLRAHLLDAGEIAERILTRADVAAASRVWFINGVRGWVELFPRGGRV